MFIERALKKDASSLQRSETEGSLADQTGNVALRWSQHCVGCGLAAPAIDITEIRTPPDLWRFDTAILIHSEFPA